MRRVTLAIVTIVVLLAVALGALALWRAADRRADAREEARLLAGQPADPSRFTAAMLDGLPDPARRFFTFAIEEGTPLHTVAVLQMEGRFGLGGKADPKYLGMRAEQVLAAPDGLLWKMSGGDGMMRISGSDSGAWTRFWLMGVLPVARAGGTADHARSAFGRIAAEAVFWTPAAVLPGPDVTWSAVDDDTARVTLRRDGFEQSVDLTVGEDGRPLQVLLQRWSDANPDKVYRLQPFGGSLSAYRRFGGFRVPTHVEAGNFFGTGDYFPFFIADITSVAYPPADGG